MTLKKGDGVLARRPLGMIDQVPAGRFGVVREVHSFGGYTVTFEGRRTLRSVSVDDVVPATAVGPWKPSDRAWFLSTPKPNRAAKRARNQSSPRTSQPGGNGPRGLRDLGLRVVIAVPVVAFLVYALTQLG